MITIALTREEYEFLLFKLKMEIEIAEENGINIKNKKSRKLVKSICSRLSENYTPNLRRKKNIGGLD